MAIWVNVYGFRADQTGTENSVESQKLLNHRRKRFQGKTLAKKKRLRSSVYIDTFYRFEYQNIDYARVKSLSLVLLSTLFSLPHLDGGFQFIPPVLTFLNRSIHVPSLLRATHTWHVERKKKSTSSPNILFFLRIFKKTAAGSDLLKKGFGVLYPAKSIPSGQEIKSYLS